MWYYAAALFGIAITAEALGLGGIPAQAVEVENILFIVFLFTGIGMMLRRCWRR